MKTIIKHLVIALITITSTASFGQEFEADLQLRPRYEYRNGYKELMKDQQYPNSFISQRSRLNLAFENDKIKTRISFQNIRIWGEVPTSSVKDQNGIALFESWASYEFYENWTAKLGRQTLVYDNQIIFGGIDWAQQGQSHDALLVSHKKNNYQLDLGAALNNNQDGLYEAAYFTNYKNMQFAWFHKKFTDWSLSLLAVNNGFEYENLIENKLETAYIQTAGAFGKWRKSNFYGDVALYLQTGETALANDKTKVAAYYAGINLGYVFSSNFKTEVGFEFLSGKDQDDADSKAKSFTPLFGTNHQFNGFMDYFYVGNHKNSVGLKDMYAKFAYEKNKWQLSLTPHLFYAAAKVLDPVTMDAQNDYLGTELDFMASYKLHPNITIIGGYSQMFASTTLETLKGGNKSYDNNWAWLMISINPELFSTKNK